MNAGNPPGARAVAKTLMTKRDLLKIGHLATDEGNEPLTPDGFETETLDALDRVYRFALQLTKDPCDCDDLVQDTYLRAYRSRHQYQLGTNCTAWLFTICHNLWIQKWQRESRITALAEPDLDEIASARRFLGSS